MRYLTIATALLALSSASCKKDKKTTVTTPIDSVIYPDYTKLTPGNYWVYEQYQLDSINGMATATNVFDSCYVEKDTVIGAHSYHKYCHPIYGSGTPASYAATYLRDSGSYVVSNTGDIVFSSQDFTNVFKTVAYTNPAAGVDDTIAVNFRMGFKDSLVSVPAGSHTASAFRKIYNLPKPKYPYGPHDYDYFYAQNIGLIKATLGWYISSPMVIEDWLVRYHVQ